MNNNELLNTIIDLQNKKITNQVKKKKTKRILQTMKI